MQGAGQHKGVVSVAGVCSRVWRILCCVLLSGQRKELGDVLLLIPPFLGEELEAVAVVGKVEAVIMTAASY